MRVTNKMISDQVIVNLGRSLDRFMNLQGQMSTGRRINKPSDDPIGTHKDLRYRSAISEIAQFRKNIDTSNHLLSTYDNVLGNMKDVIQSAYELAVSMSDSSNSEPASLEVAADEIKSIREQMADMINTQLSGKYIFSGFRTDTRTLTSGMRGFSYEGDRGQTEVKIEAASLLKINLTAPDVLFTPLTVLGENSDLNLGIGAETLLADLNLGEGIDLDGGANPGTFVVTDNNLAAGVNSVTIDISTAVSLSDAMAQINNQLAIAGFTNVSIDFGPEGNNLLWRVNDSGRISDNTRLNNLNGGAGIDRDPGLLRFHTADNSIDVTIDISEAETIGDVRTMINADANLQAAGIMSVINFGETGLEIIDTDWPATELIIESVGDASTAEDLGIAGNIGGVLNGADLNPISDFTVGESEMGQTTASNLGITGTFMTDHSGLDLNPLLRNDSLLSRLHSNLGISRDSIRISQGTSTVEINMSSAAYETVEDILNAINGSGLHIQASLNESRTGIQIISTSDTESLVVEEVLDGNTAHDWGIWGSPDIMGTLLLLEDAIRDGHKTDSSNLIGNLNAGIERLLNQRSSVGAKVVRLETADRRLVDQDFNFTKLLSEVEDADLTKLVSDLAVQENSYQAAMIAAAKIIQPSLLNFLE